ncbi:hypothetical protein Tco_0472254 [Tanacetum coccineum]
MAPQSGGLPLCAEELGRLDKQWDINMKVCVNNISEIIESSRVLGLIDELGNGRNYEIWDDIWDWQQAFEALIFPRILSLDNIKDASICISLMEPSLDNKLPVAALEGESRDSVQEAYGLCSFRSCLILS